MIRYVCAYPCVGKTTAMDYFANHSSEKIYVVDADIADYRNLDSTINIYAAYVDWAIELGNKAAKEHPDMTIYVMLSTHPDTIKTLHNKVGNITVVVPENTDQNHAVYTGRAYLRWLHNRILPNYRALMRIAYSFEDDINGTIQLCKELNIYLLSINGFIRTYILSGQL